MRVIYVGEARSVTKRIRDNHCGGNIEASAFRLHVAEEMGYSIKKTRRAKGSFRLRIDLPDPNIGEAVVNSYARSGMWSWVICASYDEAHDFQWFVIEQWRPPLNRDKKPWNSHNLPRYHGLFDKLLQAPKLPCDQLRGQETGPGVYVFHHQELPLPGWQQQQPGN